MVIETAQTEAVKLLQQMVATPSFSGQEAGVADLLQCALAEYFPGMINRTGNNLVVDLQGPVSGPTLLLCSHIDTVTVATGWKSDPFGGVIQDGKLYGLGANDAGASVVSMIAAARLLGHPPRGRLVLCLVAEEESGGNGFVAIEASLPGYDAALFGEPTGLGLATAMRGFMRAIMRSHGKACHASRPWEGRNAVDQFAADLEKLRSLDVTDTSPWGRASIEPTIIHGGTSVNQIPDLIETTLDIRTTSAKDNLWIANKLKTLDLDITITHNKRRPMYNDPDVPLVRAIRQACPDIKDYIFTGTCDMAFATAPSVVLGPGKSERSHAADEFIAISEINAAVEKYTAILNAFFS